MEAWWQVQDSNLGNPQVTVLQTARFGRSRNLPWGDRRVLPPLRPGSQPGSSLLGSITMVDQAGFEPAASGVWDRRSGLAELLIGAPTRIRTPIL
jgi:hypothetical protein